MIALLAVAALEGVVLLQPELEGLLGATYGTRLVVYLAVVVVSVAVSSAWASASDLQLVDAIGIMAAIGVAILHVTLHVDDYDRIWSALPLFSAELLLLTVYVALPVGLCTAPLLVAATWAWQRWGL